MDAEKSDRINGRFRLFAHWVPLGVLLLAILKASGHWTLLPWWGIVGILFIPISVRILVWLSAIFFMTYATFRFVKKTKKKEGE